MQVEDIKRVTVIGGGTMGNGICHHFAQMGYAVNLIDTDQSFFDKVVNGDERFVGKMMVVRNDGHDLTRRE